MTNQQAAQHCRLILFHKHGTSARTRFLRYGNNTVCAFSPLPTLAQVIEGVDTIARPPVETHPSILLNEAAHRLQLAVSALELEGEYEMWVDAPGGPIRILLVRFTDIDPPFAAAESLGARFIDLTEARDLPAVELLLLRRAYEVVLGG